ncbi:MAG: protein translocase subunit SecD [Deltaproteobacteria bacterium]|nr:protein translocase subunit SecD [Deltaproteobacteria bacterium]
MERSWYWRFLLVLGFVGLAAYYAAPSAIYFMATPEQRRSKSELEAMIPSWLPKHRFNLGIDLQGGLHLVMGVDADKAVQDRTDRMGDEILEEAQKKDIKLKSVRRPGDAPELEIVLEDAAQWEKLKSVLEAWKGSWAVKSHLGDTAVFSMDSAYETKLKDDAVAQAQKTLTNRLPVVGEAEIRRRGASSIMIQMAGLTAEQETSVKQNIIGRTAQLEFKVVDDQSTYFNEIADQPDRPPEVELKSESYQGPGDAIVTRPYLESTDRAKLKAFLDRHPAPLGRVVGLEEFRTSKNDPKPVYRTWLLNKKADLTGESLTDAFVHFDTEENAYVVIMNFDRKGADAFHRLTKENTKRKMAIVLDDLVDSAPIIQGPIPNGTARITLGGFKSQNEILDDANDLAIVLKAGALPAPVFPQEERTVGATLGDDAVRKGKLALLFAGLATLVVMIAYYRWSGVVALTAMSVNMLLLFAILAAFDATLTLPGIAGLTLTIGMAVDANIIQFERIREELRMGKTARAAVDAGFGKAFSAIFDANVTTLLASIVLYQYGSGPIRGFATTLGVGVLVNTFTAVIVPRLIFDYFTKARRVQELSI